MTIAPSWCRRGLRAGLLTISLSGAAWTGSVTTAPLPAPVDVGDLRLTKAPRTVTWTAQPGQGITPGQFQEFAINVGPLPTAQHLSLPATQTYSDGQVVHWDQTATPGGAEPEYPAPDLTLAPAAAAADTAVSGGANAVTATAQPATGQGVVEASSSDTTALGVGGLVVGAVGVGVALLGRRRTQA